MPCSLVGSYNILEAWIRSPGKCQRQSSTLTWIGKMASPRAHYGNRSFDPEGMKASTCHGRGVHFHLMLPPHGPYKGLPWKLSPICISWKSLFSWPLCQPSLFHPHSHWLPLPFILLPSILIPAGQYPLTLLLFIPTDYLIPFYTTYYHYASLYLLLLIWPSFGRPPPPFQEMLSVTFPSPFFPFSLAVLLLYNDSLQPWRRQYIPPKRWQPSTRIHSSTIRKATINIFMAMRPSNLKYNVTMCNTYNLCWKTLINICIFTMFVLSRNTFRNPISA